MYGVYTQYNICDSVFIMSFSSKFYYDLLRQHMGMVHFGDFKWQLDKTVAFIIYLLSRNNINNNKNDKIVSNYVLF